MPNGLLRAYIVCAMSPNKDKFTPTLCKGWVPATCVPAAAAAAAAAGGGFCLFRVFP